jgi:CRP-like cAMP-binding protein
MSCRSFGPDFEVSFFLPLRLYHHLERRPRNPEWREKEALMFQIAAYENYPDGTVIFTEGSHGDWIYVVDEGCVEIFRYLERQEITVAG